MRAKLENAAALLGSATPSLETYHHAVNGKYELLTLAERVENRSLAAVEIVDLRQEFQQTHQASPISQVLHAGIAECLSFQTQVLILINRRGYSWSVLCRSCGASVQCANCSISMTYHKSRNRLECHYCGSTQPVPKVCPKCDSKYVYFFGEGSEHLEERLRKEFPGARIARLDRDTARTKRQYQETLGAFAGGALDILVGTQMLAKGHDFQRVTLVGVISADSGLSLPDFRAAERTFQLLTQVAGRAGRGDLPGRVLIQTYYPEHYAIQDAVRQDYPSFFERELHFRRMMAYPPFTSLANVIVRDTKLENVIRWSRQLSEYFSPQDGKGLAHPRTGFGSAGAPEKRASLSVSAEVAETHAADEGAHRRAGLLRRARNPANRRARGYGPADVAVIAQANNRLRSGRLVAAAHSPRGSAVGRTTCDIYLTRWIVPFVSTL